LYVATDMLMLTSRVRINTLALGAKLPTMHGAQQYVEAGGLMSYGTNYAAQFQRTADYVDKILRGTKPADIPVEQPTKFDLVVNLTTAKALGLTIPETLAARRGVEIKCPAASSSRCSARRRGRSRRGRPDRAHGSRSSRSILSKTKEKTSRPSSMACVPLAMSQAKTWTSTTATPRVTRRG